MQSDVNQILESMVNGDAHASYQVFFLGQGQQQSLENISPVEILVDHSVQAWSRDEFVTFVGTIKNAEFLPIQELDEGAQGVIRYVSIKEIALLDAWIGRISQGDRLPELTSFEGVKPKAIILRRRSSVSDDVYLIKVLNDTYTLRGKSILHLIPTGVFTFMDGPSLVFDGHWDGIIANGNLALLREERLLTLFRYYEKFREAANEFVGSLAQHEAFGNMEFLAAVVDGRISLQRKLYRAAQGNLERIDFQRLQGFIDNGRIALKVVDGKIECSTVEEAKVLIDVLLDNFVKSMLTDEEYKAYNKAVLK